MNTTSSNPLPSPQLASSHGLPMSSSSNNSNSALEEDSVHRVKEEEVESEIITGWESERIEKASSWLKKLERKLDEQRARAIENKQIDVAKVRRKAEEKRASAVANRGTKVAKVLEVSNLMRTVDRAPSKRYFSLVISCLCVNLGDECTKIMRDALYCKTLEVRMFETSIL